MPEPNAQARAYRAVPTLRATGYTLLLALALAWPALIRGGAFYFPDSASYVKGGAAVARVVGALGSAVVKQPDETQANIRDADAVMEDVREDVVGLRSVTYSIFAYLMFLASESLLSLAFAQALLVAALVMVFLHVRLAAVTHAAYLTVILLLGIATSAPWYASYAMPDIFGAATILGLVLLAADESRLNTAQRLFAAALVAFAVSAHTSNMLLAIPLTLAGLLELWRQARRGTGHESPGRYLWFTAPIALGVIATMLIGAIGFGDASAVPKRYPFVLARSIADGPARWHLERHCAEYQYAVCELFVEFPDTVHDFLWGPEGLRHNATPEQMERIRAEEALIVQRALSEYPYAQVANSVKNAATQFFLFGIARLETGRKMAANEMGRPIRVASTRFDEAFVRAIEVVEYAVVVMAAAGLLAMLFRARLNHAELQAFRLLAVGLVANAIICGVISAPVHRYQGRLIWLLPLLFCVFVLSRRAKSVD